jgi:hypothetical protein
VKPLHLQCSFLRIGIDCERDRAINHAIEDSTYIRRQVNSILSRDAVQDVAQNIVFRSTRRIRRPMLLRAPSSPAPLSRPRCGTAKRL